jgi:flagellar hook-length control protein FliK
MGGFSPVLLGFHTVQRAGFGRQSLPHRQLLPAFLCCRDRGSRKKRSEIAGGASGPPVATASADHHRKYPVRASPASNLSQAHASPHAAQPTNASKADETSPFAQLVAATAPEEKKPAQSEARPDKSADDKPRDDKSPAGKNAASVRDARSQANAAPQPAESATPDSQDNSQIQNEKPVLADVTGDTAPVSDAPASDPALVAQPVTQPVAQPALPPVASPVPSLPIARAANENDASEAGTAPASDAPLPSASPVLAQDAAPQAATPPAATPTAATPTAATPQADALAAGSPQDAASTQAQPATQDTATPQAGVLAAVSPPAAASTQAQPATQDTATPQAGVLGAVSPQAAASTQAQPATQDTAAPKTQESAASITESPVTETAAPKPQTDAAENKGGAIDNAAPDSPKPDVAQTAIIETATPKAVAAPQAAPASNTNMAVQATAPTQPANAPAAHLTQHVEVSAEARPNMPSLAVEIAARSQSGARQFDIRLDPPELGRVDVRLSIDAAGKASAHLSADQPQTLDLLQKDAAVLTRALRDAGLDVSQNSLNFSLRHQGQDGSAHRGNPRTVSRAMALNATHTIEATSASTAIRGDGRLDIRV